MIIKELPVTERPREKMIRYGCGAMSNAELLAVLIGSGTRNKSAIEVAQDILAMDESGISFLGRCTLEEISAVDGIGSAKACKILAAFELGRRIATKPAADRIVINSYSDVADLFMEKMRYYQEEHFHAVLVNAHGGVISTEEIAIGDIMSMVIHPREVFAMAVRKSAAGIILAHNHPSGDCTPSADDVSTTKRLIEAGKIVGIRVLDHIVIGDGTFTSMKDKNLI